MGQRKDISKGECGFCHKPVNLFSRDCPACGKRIWCQVTPAYAQRSGSWASTSQGCQKRARYVRADGLCACGTHRDKGN